MFGMMKKKTFGKSSLRTVISLVTIAFALLGSLAFVIISYIMISVSSAKDIKAKTEMTSARLANALEEPLWNLNALNIENVVTSELDDEQMLAIVVRDDKGILIDARERLPPKAGTKEPGIRSLATSELPDLAQRAYALKRTDIVHGTEKIGDIAAYTTKRDLSRAFFSQLPRTLGISLCMSIAIAILLFYAIDRLVSNRVLKLERVVSRFTAHDFSARAESSMHDEIGDLADAFNLMADTIQRHEHDLQAEVDERTRQILDMEKFAFLGSLVAGVAHEVNTPLGVAVTATSNAKMLVGSIEEEYGCGSLDEGEFVRSLAKVVESLGIAEMNLERAAEFIRSFKRMAVDQTAEDVRSVKIKEYLEEVVLSLRPKLRKSRVQVSVNVPDELELVCAPGAVYQVFTNLIVNSLVHAFDEGAQGNILISGERDGDGFTFIYRDDGKGIAPEVIGSIFEPFFTTKRNVGGSGLGLYIAKTTITKMGGRISCASELGKGVEFRISIPM
jgi:two-component system, NtrC family, sensor kinase